MTGIRVAIADDHALFCAGIQMLIESQSDLLFVGSALDGAAAIELAATAQPDVMLMDIRMPVLDGIAATARIVDGEESPSSQSRPRIIMLTTFQRDEAVVHAIRAGADGFLMKDTTPEFMLASIRAVHAGHSVIAPSETAQLLGATRVPDRPTTVEDTLTPLSAREREVFLLVARGLSNSDIAQSAFITEATVKSHVTSILAKLGLSSRVQVVAHAYENGLIR